MTIRISEEITQRIKKGNRAYHTHKGLMTSKLINKYNKRKFYMIWIRPAVTYTCEPWTLSVRDTSQAVTYTCEPWTLSVRDTRPAVTYTCEPWTLSVRDTRPAGTYTCDPWTLSVRDINNL